MESREVTASYRLSQWANIIQERIASGELVEEFCLRKGISKHKYYYWQQKLRKVAGERLAKMESKTTDMTVRGFTEVKLTESPMSSVLIGPNQICIETVACRITAGSAYPPEALVVVLRELGS